MSILSSDLFLCVWWRVRIFRNKSDDNSYMLHRANNRFFGIQCGQVDSSQYFVVEKQVLNVDIKNVRCKIIFNWLL